MKRLKTWHELQISAAQGAVRNAAMMGATAVAAPFAWVEGAQIAAIVLGFSTLMGLRFTVLWWHQFKDCIRLEADFGDGC